MANATIEAIEEPAARRADPWRTIWNSLTSNTLLAAVLLAMALVFALAAWLPQSPDSASDPVAFSQWRGETQTHFGSSFALLQQSGLFSLERGPILRLLGAGLALCLSLRLVESIQSAWHARSSPQPLRYTPLEVNTEQPLDDIIVRLRKQRFRVAVEGEAVYADRFPLADAGQIALALGGLLIIAGLAFSSATGWHLSKVTLGRDQRTPIGHGTPYSLRLDALDPGLTGRISLLKEDDAVAEGRLAVGQPLRQGDLTVFLTGAGPAVRASATFTDGRVLRLQASASSAPVSELLFLLTRDEPDRYIGAPEAGLVVRVSRGTGESRLVHVQIYRSKTGTMAFEGDASSRTVVSVENANFTLSPEAFAVLSVARDTGLPVTLTGAVILALGLVIAAVWPVERLAALANNNGTWLRGDADLVQALEPGATSVVREQGWQQVIAPISWKIGLMLLSGTIGLLSVRSLMRNGMLWPSTALVSAFTVTWLASCATSLLPQRWPRWAVLALTLTLLIIAVSRPGLLIAPDL